MMDYPGDWFGFPALGAGGMGKVQITVPRQRFSLASSTRL
jgi:hypothetical protein